MINIMVFLQSIDAHKIHLKTLSTKHKKQIKILNIMQRYIFRHEIKGHKNIISSEETRKYWGDEMSSRHYETYENKL